MDDGGERGVEIAVIGMAARFPGAPDVDAFWRNLCEGVESIAFFGAEAAAARGVDRELLARPDYVRAHGALAGVDLFDASYFGYSPREAELMDPQHRIFLELAAEALERAGYAGGAEEPVIGVYAGSGENTYLLSALAADPGLVSRLGPARVLSGAQADYLATRVSYKLDLRGPSFTVKTACSTSLVAVHLACQGLLSGECDVAVAGAVAVWVPQEQGYLHEEDGVLSPDGHCRAFDAAARGTVPASGAGAVVLRRLDEALEDGDPIEAVIKGSVINNDGSTKAGFSAPSVEGQALAIRTAHLVAGVEPETVGYVETHGTATPLGDPIEVAALEEAFACGARSAVRCALGSVKTNIGHCGAAAGIAGLIKTVLAVKHGLLPPSLHFERPNPEIDFESSRFRVQTSLGEWPALPGPRRAGVSAFGIGGTNAHVVVEEAPPPSPPGPAPPRELIVLSALTESALERLTDNLADHLRRHPELPAADVAYTLQAGRRAHGCRRAAVTSGSEDAARVLAARDPRRLLEGRAADGDREVFFLFSGLGDQYPGMGRELHERQPVFRDAVDRCCRLLAPRLGRDLRSVLFPPPEAAATPELDRADLAQPAVFVVGYALAELWRSWGIRCRAALGYSLGEYLAAWQAGVFSLEDALFLVAERAKLIRELPAGAMLAVPLGVEELRPLLGPELSLAADAAPSMSVAAGPPAAVAELRGRLAADGVAGRLVQTSHALHTERMAPIAERFAERLREVRLEPPRTPYVSNVTGTWARPEEATDPDYWVRHLRHPVRFSEGVGELLAKSESAFLEIGPGTTLATLVRQHGDPRGGGRRVVTSLGPADAPGSDFGHLLRSLGLLWLSGAAVDWPAVHRHERRRRVALPTYPFERRRYWLGPGPASGPPAPAAAEIRTARHDRPALATAYAPPASDLETAIADLWQKVLGLARVGIHDDFFELGGHSFLAVALLAEIRDELGEELPLSAVFRAPTVARMAALIAAGGDLGSPAAVPIQPAGWRAPFFCAAPVMGTVFPYYELARNLGRDQPFYGLQPPAVARDGPPLGRIEDQAAHFIAALKEIQDTGPYHLGGWSFGTLVAYEMARQLAELGDEIGLVALFDAPAPVPSQRLSPWDLAKLFFDVVVRDFAPYVRDYLYLVSAARRAERNGGGERRAPLSLRLLAEGAAMAAVVPPESRLERLRPPQVRAMLRALRANNRAAASYRPPPFAGRVTLFRTGRNGDRDPGLGWGELAAGGVDVRYVPGNHMSLLRRPQVETLAGELAECLQGRRT